MKKLLLLSVLFISIIACKNEKKVEVEEVSEEIAYQTFGAEFSADGFIAKEEMMAKFKTMKAGDTLDVKFASKINSVCKAKGCWMRLDLGDENESMVKFKDYGFFVPLNSDDREVIVNGKAYVTEVSVEEQQHYAKDGGKTEEEIAMITEPEYTYSFLADGVLMKE